MTARLISESRPPGAPPPIVLHVFTRPGWPAFLAPTFADLFEIFWLAPIVCEGPAPMPVRDYRHVARIFAESTAVGRS